MKNRMYLFLFSLTWLTLSVSAMDLPPHKRKFNQAMYLDSDHQNKKRKTDEEYKLERVENVDAVIAKKLLDLDPFALHSACQKEQIGLLKFLLSQGVDTTIQDNDGCTPLHIASEYDSVKSLDLLLASGVDIDIKNGSGETPLHLASFYGNKKAAEYLLKCNANVNAQSMKGATPLHQACLENFLEIVHLLIYYKANVNIQDCYGNTPLHVNGFRYHKKIDDKTKALTCCLSLRCNESLKNNAGKYAKDMLPFNIDPEVYEMFENK